MRERRMFDMDWRFRLAGAEALGSAGLNESGTCRVGGAGWECDDADWRGVDLPHDFVVERHPLPEAALPEAGRALSSKSGGYRPGGVGWYRKHFSMPQEDQARRTYLHFEGLYRDSRVYLNEFFVGRHLSGYTSVYFDISDFLREGGENLLAVRVDATQNEGWWYEGGGIYRHVWLEQVSPVHVAPWGTFVSSEVSLGTTPSARLTVRTRVANKGFAPVTCRICSTIVDPDGQQVAQGEEPLALPAWEEAELCQSLALSAAKLWSLETPHLYRLVTTIVASGQEVDQVETTFGIRSFRFDPAQGFFLNEMPVKIRGACCHHDHAGVGIAVPDRLHEFRLERLKEMGCNAYRSAHHPAAPALLDACDRLGLLVVDENRRLSSSTENLAQLESMIRRDRNHPSVILWSLGNEEVSIQWQPQSRRITRSMMALAKQLDPTRPVTLAICYWNPETDEDEPLANTPLPAGELDVMGFNYSHQLWEAYHATHPEQPAIVTEASSGLRTRGCYFSDAARGHVIWEDVCDDAREQEQWRLVAERPFLSGIFVWTGFDYRGEPTPSNWPAISSHFGLMDTCGFPKDSYHYYRAWWCDAPVLHLAPHWNWPDRVGQPVKVSCYSNCDEVELLLNGESLGRKAMERYRHLEWPEVPYRPGVLEACGYRTGARVATACVETTGSPHALRLLPDREGIKADRRDVAVVAVQVVDAEGRVVPTADNEICFVVEGPGRILGVGNGNPGSLEPDTGAVRRAFNGLCQVILQSDVHPGTICLIGTSPGLRTGQCRIRTEP